MRKTVVPVMAALSVVAAACAQDGDSTGDPADTLPRSDAVVISYEVRLRDGGTADADIRVGLPSGKSDSRNVEIPWVSEPFAFEKGDVMRIEAEVKGEAESPLLCVLASRDKEQGAYVFASIDQPLTACETEYELGQWPPDDDDPLGNPLIRVG